MEGDGGCEHPTRYAQAIEVELRRPLDHVADLLPVHQIPALEHRDAGVVGECRGDEVELVAGTGHGWIRMEPGQHRVAVMARRQRLFERRVVPSVLEPVEQHRLACL